MNDGGGEIVDGGITVLFVDDYPAYVDAGEEYLESVDDGIRVLAETCAEAALEHLSERTVDCVVCDYEMPEMDGAEFVESAREAEPQLPVILLTGHEPERLESHLDDGTATVLQKGSGTHTFEELRSEIRAVAPADDGFRFDDVPG